MLPILDLVLLVIILVAFLLIGVYFRFKQKANSADYFLAGRTMSSLPAAFSISVSFVSSVSLTLYIGEISSYGNPYYLMAASGFIAGPVLIYCVLPRFYDSPYLSIYQYLEDRYSRPVKIVNSLIFMCAGAINCGTVGYAASISAEILAEIPFWASALAVGLLSTVYSTMGGIRAVIWTDFGQALFMLLFFILILVKALISFDSLSDAWNLIVAGDRTHLNFYDGPTYRYSFQNITVFYVIWYLFVLSISQPGVQRWKSVPTLRDAKITVILSFVLFGLFAILVYVTGLVLYAFYARCDMPQENIKPDKLSLHFVSRELANIPGVLGLCLAGILSSALSTISSFINSFAAVTLEDFIKIKFKSMSTSKELLVGKLLTAAFGILATGIIFLAAQSSSAFVVHMTAYAISISPPLGIFFLGLWSKRTNAFGASAGFALSVALLVWISIGAYLTGTRHETLTDDNPLCWGTNYTSFYNETNTRVMKSVPHEQISPESGLLDGLYYISFPWYPAIGLATTTVFGYTFSIAYDAVFRAHKRRRRTV